MESMALASLLSTVKKSAPKNNTKVAIVPTTKQSHSTYKNTKEFLYSLVIFLAATNFDAAKGKLYDERIRAMLYNS